MSIANTIRVHLVRRAAKTGEMPSEWFVPPETLEKLNAEFAEKGMIATDADGDVVLFRTKILARPE